MKTEKFSEVAKEREKSFFPNSQDKEQLILSEVAFDEMNIVETPFALLTKDTSGKTEVPLTPDRSVVLATIDSSEFGLPNSLATRVVLGLMWLCKVEHNLNKTFKFGLRKLVKDYIYPNRFNDYEPYGDLLSSVEKQINCVANTRIFNNRWWDNELQKITKMNAAIIDSVSVVEEGGRNRPRVIEISWGSQFYKSLVSQYTKRIDIEILLRIDSPIDLQLYRILDRQLATKNKQKYNDIVQFAKGKLAMTGKRIDKGGRTASSYVAGKLKESVKRLSLKGFSVRMEIDSSSNVFSVEFLKTDKSRPNETVEQDRPGELIKEFHYHAHNRSLKEKRRIPLKERTEALKWIDTYGFEKAKWMVGQCVKLQKEMKREPILYFTGLHIYESTAAGDYEKHKEEESQQLNLVWEERLEKLWAMYESAILRKYEQETPDGEKQAFEDKARNLVKRNKQFSSMKETLLRPVIDAYLKSLKFEKMGALKEEVFKNTQSSKELNEILTKTHGHNPLEKNPPQSSAEANMRGESRNGP